MTRSCPMPEWRPIPGAPAYDVSSDGRVRHAASGRLLTPTVSRRNRHGGYPTVSLVLRTGRRANIYVHRAVAAAFLFMGEIPRGTVVCHRDDNPANATLANLYVGDQRQNCSDARKNRVRDRRADLLAERKAGLAKLRADVVAANATIKPRPHAPPVSPPGAL